MTEKTLDSDPIIVEQLYRAPTDRVWRAITEPEQTRQWFFESIESFKPVVGFKTQFNVVAGEKTYLHLWEITEVIPGKRIVYDWKYGGYPGDSSVEFELIPVGEQTKLKLTHTVLESFPRDNPDFSRESGIAGWTFFICERLKDYLDKD